ncbi:hypothetical protein [Muricoccus radiodurans]|uniref:hypothetical protein n=1 Tax=Muricoccus radiodurans TaxID=2231721 RepID=UPI003CF81E03
MAVEDGYRAAGAVGGDERARLAGAVAGYEVAGGDGGEAEVRLMLRHLMEHKGADYLFRPLYDFLERRDRKRGHLYRGNVMWNRPASGRRMAWRRIAAGAVSR